MKKTIINKENLILYGMTENKGDGSFIMPMEKVISVPNEDADEDEGDLAICVTTMRNSTEICLRLPDGAVIYLNVQSIEQLKAFEKCIGCYEPPY
jgi:hypothetical protein